MVLACEQGATVSVVVCATARYDFLRAMENRSDLHIVGEKYVWNGDAFVYQIRSLEMPRLYDGLECDAVMSMEDGVIRLQMFPRDRSPVYPCHWKLMQQIKEACK